MDKQIAIKKLRHLAELQNKQAELYHFINDECDRDIEEKIEIVRKKVFSKQPDSPAVRSTYVNWTEYKPT